MLDSLTGITLADIPPDRPLTPISPLSTPEPHSDYDSFPEDFNLDDWPSPPSSPYIELPSLIPDSELEKPPPPKSRYPHINGNFAVISPTEKVRLSFVEAVNKFDWVLPEYSEPELSPEIVTKPDFSLRAEVTQIKRSFRTFGQRPVPTPPPKLPHRFRPHPKRPEKPRRTRKRRKYRALKRLENRR